MAMTRMRARRKRQSLCIWKSTWILTGQIMKRKRQKKIKDMVGAVGRNQEESQTTGRLPTLLPVTRYAPLHHPKERHDWHAQCPPDFASNSCPLDYLQLFSIMTFLTCWYKIQTCILLVKMPRPMRLDPGSQPQFQKRRFCLAS